MSIQKFEDGSVLYTGDDIYKAFEEALNVRNKHKKNCDFCLHEECSDYCNDCSLRNPDLRCSCHINPPCSYCVESKFEVTPFLINFKNFYQGRYSNQKSKWECFPADKETFEKFNMIEKEGFVLSAEILTTGEIAVYLDKENLDDNNEQIKICQKHQFKETAIKMIKELTCWRR